MKITDIKTKKFKKAKRDELILVQWSFGFLLILLTSLIMGIYEISVQVLAGLSLGLLFMAAVLKVIRKIFQARAARGIPISAQGLTDGVE